MNLNSVTLPGLTAVLKPMALLPAGITISAEMIIWPFDYLVVMILFNSLIHCFLHFVVYTVIRWIKQTSDCKQSGTLWHAVK